MQRVLKMNLWKQNKYLACEVARIIREKDQGVISIVADSVLNPVGDGWVIRIQRGDKIVTETVNEPLSWSSATEFDAFSDKHLVKIAALLEEVEDDGETPLLTSTDYGCRLDKV